MKCSPNGSQQLLAPIFFGMTSFSDKEYFSWESMTNGCDENEKCQTQPSFDV